MINIDSYLTLLGMGLVTYMTRVTGVWIVSQLTESDRLKKAIAFLPGAVLISIVLPPLLQKGLPEG